MKKEILLSLLAITAMLSLPACDKEQEKTAEVQTINVLAPKDVMFEAASTKGASVRDGSSLVFNWTAGDIIGVFPDDGDQLQLPIPAAKGSTSATFDVGGRALKNDASYAAYYPFSGVYHKVNEAIVMDYTGQVQDGNGSFAHISAYDFLASAKVSPKNNAVTLQMVRQGSILCMDIPVPQPEEVKSLVISCEEAIFVEKATLDISGNTPVVTPVKMTDKLTLMFVNIKTTAANETVRVYMAVQPVDFSAKTVTVTIAVGDKKYWAPVTPIAIERGKAAVLRFSDEFKDNSVVSNPTATITDFEFDGEVTT